MKKIYLLLFLLYSINTTAQKTPLDSFYKIGTSWCETYNVRAPQGQITDQHIKFKVLKDTSINSTDYKLVGYDYITANFGPGPVTTHNVWNIDTRIAGLRVSGSKVYAFVLGKLPSPRDTSAALVGSEYLLYDFDISKDSILTWKAGKKKVLAVDSVQLSNGEYVKRYKFLDSSATPSTYKEYWIHGLGSTKGLFDPICVNNTYPPPSAPVIYSWISVSHYENSSLEYNYYSGAPKCMTPAVSVATLPVETFKIYPNPVRGGDLYITTHRDIREVSITDAYGRTVYSKRGVATGMHRIDIYLASGMYIIRVVTEDNNILTQKLVKTE